MFKTRYQKADQLDENASPVEISKVVNELLDAVKEAAAKEGFAKAQQALNEASAAVPYDDEEVKNALAQADALGEEATLQDVVDATKALNDAMRAADKKAQDEMQSEAKEKAYEALQNS